MSEGIEQRTLTLEVFSSAATVPSLRLFELSDVPRRVRLHLIAVLVSRRQRLFLRRQVQFFAPILLIVLKALKSFNYSCNFFSSLSPPARPLSTPKSSHVWHRSCSFPSPPLHFRHTSSRFRTSSTSCVASSTATCRTSRKVRSRCATSCRVVAKY